jgi:hypothetical protein
MKKIVLLLHIFSFTHMLSAQNDEAWVGGSRFGIKGGPSVGLQGNNSPLFRYHGVAFVEGGGNENNTFVASIGYHARGIAPRYQIWSPTPTFKSRSIPSVFHNVGFGVAVKHKRDYTENAKTYYLLGLRGEYTVGSNLPRLDLNNPNNPTNNQFGNGMYANYVRPLNWGMDLGAGIEKKITELITGFAEITFSPDFSYQYRLLGPSGSGGGASVSGLRNTSIELSVGVNFWRKVIYE